MSNDMIKRVIPLQTNDSEFDNFLGLKFGMSMGEVLFKIFCAGFYIDSCSRKKRNITIFALIRNGECCSREIYASEFDFIPYKGKYLLNSIGIMFKHGTDEEENKIVTELRTLIEKFSLINKKGDFIHKPTKRFVTLLKTEETTMLFFGEKGSDMYLDIGVHFQSFFVRYSGEILEHHSIRIEQIFTNSSIPLSGKQLSEKETNEQIYLLVGLLGICPYSRDEYISYSEFWSNFFDFWESKNHAKHLQILAEKFADTFMTQTDNYDEKSIKEQLKNIIQNIQTEIKSSEQKKKNERKAEKKAAEEAGIKNLEESLDDF